MRRYVSMRAKEQSASKTFIPDAQGILTPEGSSMAAAGKGRGGHVSGGVSALGAYEAGRPGNPRDPAPSTVIAGSGETRQQSSNADGAFTGVPEGGEEQTSVPVVDGGERNRSRRRRGQGVGEPRSSVEDGEPYDNGTRPSEGGSCCCDLQGRNMAGPLRSLAMSPQLLKVAELGRSARRSSGRAGWWKPPCPVLRGPRSGNGPGLLDNLFRSTPQGKQVRKHCETKASVVQQRPEKVPDPFFLPRECRHCGKRMTTWERAGV